MKWHTNPPEWADYVSSVIVVDRGTDLHIAIDMRSKHVECQAEMAENGDIHVVFYATPSTMGDVGREQIVWPSGLGPWPETGVCPVLVVDIGGVDRARDLEIVGPAGSPGACPSTACPHRYVGRYEVHVSLVRRVDWDAEHVVVDPPPEHDPYCWLAEGEQ